MTNRPLVLKDLVVVAALVYAQSNRQVSWRVLGAPDERKVLETHLVSLVAEKVNLSEALRNDVPKRKCLVPASRELSGCSSGSAQIF